MSQWPRSFGRRSDSLQLPQNPLPSFFLQRRQPLDHAIAFSHIQDLLIPPRIILQPQTSLFQYRSFSKWHHIFNYTMLTGQLEYRNATSLMALDWCALRLAGVGDRFLWPEAAREQEKFSAGSRAIDCMNNNKTDCQTKWQLPVNTRHMKILP